MADNGRKDEGFRRDIRDRTEARGSCPTPSPSALTFGLRDSLARLTPAQVREVLGGMDAEQLQAVAFDWEGVWARPEQVPPDDGDWTTFLYLAGRGAGKTRSAAEWVRKVAGQFPGCRIAVVARTAADVRDVCIEGESGLLAVHPPAERPLYEPSKRRVTWRNGSQATAYSADEPDLLRGPQNHFAWCDELATWQRLEETWSNLQFGLRLGDRPRCIVTTTPRPLPLLRELLKSPSAIVRRGTTWDNAANLAPSALAEFRSKYEGTRLGRQELGGEILEDVPGALWTRAMLDGSRVNVAPELVRVVVAVDPAATSGEEADETGIVVAGRSADGAFYVLADRSCRLTPDGWARRAVAAYDEHGADRLVAEANQGGEMVASVLRTVRPALPVTLVRATRGKRVRAEPIAALYEQGRVHHVGGLGELEDQMCAFTPDAILEKSPDRVDALVWALTELSGRGGSVFAFSPARNALPKPPSQVDATSAVVGVRLGVEADALAVLRWGRHTTVVRLVDEWTGPRETATALAGRVRRAIEKHGTRVVVVDPGALGRALVEELRARHRLPLVLADPKDRLASIELLNDSMQAGNFLAPPDGAFARECQALEWDRTKATPEIVGSSVLADAVLAAFPRVAAWAVKPRPATPDEERARLAASLAKARAPLSAEELNAKARAEMGEYGRELARERRRVERNWGFLWGHR